MVTREGLQGKAAGPRAEAEVQVGRPPGPGRGRGTHIVLRGAAQAAGLALDALPAVGPHGRRHVHREL